MMLLLLLLLSLLWVVMVVVVMVLCCSTPCMQTCGHLFLRMHTGFRVLCFLVVWNHSLHFHFWCLRPGRRDSVSFAFAPLKDVHNSCIFLGEEIYEDGGERRRRLHTVMRF